MANQRRRIQQPVTQQSRSDASVYCNLHEWQRKGFNGQINSGQLAKEHGDGQPNDAYSNAGNVKPNDALTMPPNPALYPNSITQNIASEFRLPMPHWQTKHVIAIQQSTTICHLRRRYETTPNPTIVNRTKIDEGTASSASMLLLCCTICHPRQREFTSMAKVTTKETTANTTTANQTRTEQ